MSESPYGKGGGSAKAPIAPVSQREKYETSLSGPSTGRAFRKKEYFEQQKRRPGCRAGRGRRPEKEAPFDSADDASDSARKGKIGERNFQWTERKDRERRGVSSIRSREIWVVEVGQKKGISCRPP